MNALLPIVLVLPWPTSANDYWRSFPHPTTGRTVTVVSREAKAYKEEVSWRAKAAGVRAPLAGPIEVTYHLFPRLPKDWMKRVEKDPVWWDLTVKAMDLDNCRKVLNDAMKNIVFGDDSMIRKDPGEIMVPDGEARVVVTIKPYERPHPQDSLFAREPVYVPRETKPDKPKRIKRDRMEVPLRPDGKPF